MGTIYLQADASDLLCERSREWLRHTMRNAPGEARRMQTRRHDFGSGEEWDVYISWPAPGSQVSIVNALGEIDTHTDPAFPKHALLWVLRSSGAVVTCPRGPKVSQPTGYIIAFNCHQPHALRYPGRPMYRPRLWAALSIDADEPWTVKTAREAIKRTLGLPVHDTSARSRNGCAGARRDCPSDV